MIQFDPPISTPYIPSTQKIAFVNWNFTSDGDGHARANLQLLDEAKQPIAVHQAKMPRGDLSPQQIANLGAQVSAAIGALLLPVIQENLGIQGGKVV
jgi:hypothetical protein